MASVASQVHYSRHAVLCESRFRITRCLPGRLCGNSRGGPAWPWPDFYSILPRRWAIIHLFPFGGLQDCADGTAGNGRGDCKLAVALFGRPWKVQGLGLFLGPLSAVAMPPVQSLGPLLPCRQRVAPAARVAHSPDRGPVRQPTMPPAGRLSMVLLPCFPFPISGRLQEQVVRIGLHSISTETQTPVFRGFGAVFGFGVGCGQDENASWTAAAGSGWHILPDPGPIPHKPLKEDLGRAGVTTETVVA